MGLESLAVETFPAEIHPLSCLVIRKYYTTGWVGIRFTAMAATQVAGQLEADNPADLNLE